MPIIQTQLCIIGGGAAGMMCAVTASGRGVKTVIVEGQRKFGRKIRITGKGRCNVTNNSDRNTFLKSINHNPKFMYSAYSGFDSAKCMEFFQALGVPLKSERGNRVFPQSDNANDIAEALYREMVKNKVNFVRQKAISVVKSDDLFVVSTDSDITIKADKVVICTGGLSYPLTGSTGDGYKFAKSFGHSIVPCEGSLVGLRSNNGFCGILSGLTLKNVALTLLRDNVIIYKEQGEMLFTQTGISGPLVLTGSSKINDGDNNITAQIDFKPALDFETLDARVLRDFDKYKNKSLKNAMNDLLPQSLIPFVIKASGINPDTPVNSITKQQRHSVVNTLKAFPINITGKESIEGAIVTKGGVDVKEINPRTMESKIVPGLYFAGEVMDVDACTGGFNLQIAWSTGYLAGMSV